MSKVIHKKSETVLKVLLLSIGSLSGNLLCASADNSVSKEESDWSYYSDQEEENTEENGEEVHIKESCSLGWTVYHRKKDGTIVAPSEVHGYVTSRGKPLGHWRNLSWYGRSATFDELPKEKQLWFINRSLDTLRKGMTEPKKKLDIKFFWDLSKKGRKDLCSLLTKEQKLFLFEEIMRQDDRGDLRETLDPSYNLKAGSILCSEVLQQPWMGLSDYQKGTYFKKLPTRIKLTFYKTMTLKWQGENFHYYVSCFPASEESVNAALLEAWDSIPEEYKTEENLKLIPKATQDYIREHRDVHQQ